MGGTSYAVYGSQGGGGSGGGVTSLNAETGNITLTSVDSSVTITPGVQTIDLSVVSGGAGDVVGPASATDNAIARFDTTTGKLIQNSGAILDDSGNVGFQGTVVAGQVIDSGLTVNTVPYTDSSKQFTSSAVTPTQLGYLSGTSGTTGTTNLVLSSAPTLSNPVVGTQSQGDASTKAASTAYVDTAVANAIAGVNPAVAVQAATTAAGDTSGLTYNNGASGVGATFIGTTNTALVIDGFTFTAVGQRILVKNDTQSPSGAFNGIYSVTQVQTLGLPPILTRATDYNTPSDMNNTGAIPVVNGTVNGTTSWVLTSQVVTVGTTPLTFTKFSINPSTIVTAVSVASANGFAGSSSGGSTPIVTISTSINSPVLAGNGTAIAAATVTGTGSTVVLSAAPTMTNPVVGTQSPGDNTTKAASTAFVTAAVAAAGGATAIAVLTKTADYTILTGDFSGFRLMAEMNATGIATLTLPAASNSGYEVSVINIGGGIVTIACAGSDTFGSTSDQTWTLIPGGSPQSSNKFISNGGSRWNGF